MSGVYKIYCKSNNKIYIGSSFDIFRRWRFHKSQLNRNAHSNILLQRAWKLYGENSFVWKIVEFCPNCKLLIVEKKWFKKTKCCDRKYGFNIAIDTSSPMKGHKHSVKTKIKMSKTHKGKIISEDQRQKTSQTLLRKGKAKLTNRIIHTIIKLVEEGELTQTEIGKLFKIDQSQVSRIKTKKKWRYIKKE